MSSSPSRRRLPGRLYCTRRDVAHAGGAVSDRAHRDRCLPAVDDVVLRVTACSRPSPAAGSAARCWWSRPANSREPAAQAPRARRSGSAPRARRPSWIEASSRSPSKGRRNLTAFAAGAQWRSQRLRALSGAARGLGLDRRRPAATRSAPRPTGGRPRSAWPRGRPCRPARYSLDLVRHGVGGQRHDRRPRAAGRGFRARGSGAVAVGPSITGICMSIRIRSQGAASQAATAELAVLRRPPARRRPAASSVFSTSWLTALSSAASTRSDEAAGRLAGGAAVGAARRSAGSPTRGSGRVTVKVEPSPGRLSAADRAAHQLGELAADRQAEAVPPNRRVVEASAWANLSNSCPASRPGCRSPVSADGDAQPAVERLPPSRTTSPRVGELQRVGDEVDRIWRTRVGSPR